MKSRISDETRFKQGRGSGDRESYKPFLKVRDFSSSGRTHRPPGQLIKRHHELFSDLEYFLFCHFDFADNIYDIKEQINLDLTDTIRIAKNLGVVHSPINDDKKFVMTSDFLIIKKDGTKKVFSVKPSSELNKKRVLQKLGIEYEYWTSRGIEWILITEKEFDPIVLKNIKQLRESFMYKSKHLKSFFLELKKFDWESNCNLSEVIRNTSRKVKITFGEGRRIFDHLVARKVIRFDYTKPLSIDMPIYNFKINNDTTT
ncbi:MAG: TnsA endonuclease N-terminal domain-containing protein [Flavobacterium sp.]|jgi:hypothetical protein|nr:TnsA endonuclease N-terminal domain-containing protein [Flavobacterium sp.]